MDTLTNTNLGKAGATLVDKSADKLQQGIRDTQYGAKSAGDAIAGKADNLRRGAPAVAGSVADQANKTAKQGMDKLEDAVEQTQEAVSRSAGSIIAYAKKNPVKALLIAAASGALVWTLLKPRRASRS